MNIWIFKNIWLIELENKLISEVNYGLPSTNRNDLNPLLNEIIRETSYNLDYLNDYIK